MTKRLIVDAEAEAELAAAFDWYESQREGLGIELLTSLDETLAAVVERPDSFPTYAAHPSH